ncbi:hypothetical protein ILUMI_20338, partial [Ignelater luminosus]
SVRYVPEDRKIEVLQNQYLFGIEYDPSLQLWECRVTSNTGKFGTFYIERRSSNKQIHDKEDSNLNTRANEISSLGYMGFCQVIIFGAVNDGLTRWDLVAKKYQWDCGGSNIIYSFLF